MKKKARITARISGSICGTLLAIVIALPCMYFYYIFNVMANVPTTPNITMNPEIDTTELNGYTNIACFGLDSRNGSYEKGNRSDSIIIISINNDTKEIKLSSVFRDTYLNIPDHGLNKATHAYFYGGPELAVNMLNKNLDLNIQKYISINWFATAKVIDKLGGIDVNIEQYELKELNRVINMTNDSFSTKAQTINTTGPHTLNGIQAVSYARMRKHGVGDDFKRAERQRLVMELAFKKAKAADISTVINIINAIAPDISMNFTLQEALKLAQPILKYSVAGNLGFPMNNTCKTINGMSCVVANNLVSDVRELHAFLFGRMEYEPSQTVKEIQAQITNKLLFSPKPTTPTVPSTPTTPNNSNKNNNTTTNPKDNTNTPNKPKEPEAPIDTLTPDDSDTTNTPDTPNIPDTPNTDTPNTPDIPDTPDNTTPDSEPDTPKTQ